MKYVSVSQIVSDICAIHLMDEMQQQAGRVIRSLMSVLSEYSITAGLTVVSREFTLSGLTLNMPDDTMEVFNVGVVCDGKIRMMGEMSNIKRTDCGCSGNDSCLSCTFPNYVSGSIYRGEMYGRREPQFSNGTYRYDKQLNRIEFGSGYDIFDGNEVVVSYRTSLSEEALDLIPANWQLAIQHKTLALFFAASNPGVSQYNMREFQRHHNQLKRNQNPLQLNEILAAIRGNRVSSPR